MNLFGVALTVCAIFAGAYITYGRYLSRRFDLCDDRRTPACEINDGVDFVPAPKGFLLAQHFSAIAAAGPIVGPILAGLWFGWLPVLLWIVGGAIFFGSVHDFSTLAGSVRHGARSIVEMVRELVGRRGYLLFLGFVWLSLLYVITAFTDLTSSSFVEPELGGGVATSSFLYLLIGLAMGIALYRFKLPLGPVSAVGLPLVVVAIAFGRFIPLHVPAIGGLSPQQVWNLILLGYCLVASVIPVWLLLQPRGYLGGFFLYVTLAAGIIGLFLGGEKILYPAFIGFTSEKGLPLFPLLFVTVACGACSGFHGIVSSGTTSKQIARETDCHMVGYGGMLLEGLVALVALSTVMVLAKGDALTGAPPDRVYAEGLSRFVEHFGIPRQFALSFTLLAFTTFIYDTLDVATRLARYIFQELTGWKGKAGRIGATVASLIIPMICVSLRVTDASGNAIPAWRIFWTVFGTSNQLLAALTLMILTLWLARSRKPWAITIVPMLFLFTMTLWSLYLMIQPAAVRWAAGNFAPDWIALIALLLSVLAFILCIEVFRSFRTARQPA